MEQEKPQDLDIFEQAKREGLRLFPDDPKGAELVQKNILMQLSEEEENSLLQMIQKKQYSPDVLELFKRSREHDPLFSLVEVNHGVHVHVSPDVGGGTNDVDVRSWKMQRDTDVRRNERWRARSRSYSFFSRQYP
jgi:hypothetical protein